MRRLVLLRAGLRGRLELLRRLVVAEGLAKHAIVGSRKQAGSVVVDALGVAT